MAYSLFFKENGKETKSGLSLEITNETIIIYHFYNGEDVNPVATFDRHFFNQKEVKKIMKELFNKMQHRF